MHRVSKIHGLICTQAVQQALVYFDELGLLFGRCIAWQPLWLTILKPQSSQKLDAACMGIVEVERLLNMGSDLDR